MLTTILLTIIILGAMMFLLSLGTILANKSLKGSCGESCECTLKDRRECTINNNDIQNLSNN
tara:strand:- start:280 stop:465 length:186 start_codon:yes stop_codon:yes gene_type:complete